MNTVLFCLPIKENCLDQYKAFLKGLVHQRKNEYNDMLKRYEIHFTKVWTKNFNGKDYALVYHKVGPGFSEKIKSFSLSPHPFDKWMNEQLNTVYDASPIQDHAIQLIDFTVN